MEIIVRCSCSRFGRAGRHLVLPAARPSRVLAAVKLEKKKKKKDIHILAVACRSEKQSVDLHVENLSDTERMRRRGGFKIIDPRWLEMGGNCLEHEFLKVTRRLNVHSPRRL